MSTRASTTRKTRARAIPSDPSRWPPCVRCTTSYQRAVHWPEGRVCHYCVSAARLREGRCAGCGHDGVLPGLDPAGQLICVSCSAIPLEVRCRRCGAETPLGRTATCWRCLLTARIHELLAGRDGTIPQALQPLATAITTMPSANSGYTWLRSNPRVEQLLTQLATSELALDHRAFDQLPGSRTVEFIRGLLVGQECLPARDPHLGGFERWIATKLDTIHHPDHRQIVDRFARWHLLRQLRDRADRGQISDGAFLNAKQSTTVATGFLSWLGERGTALAELTQHDIDAWFASGPTTRKHAVRFLYWSREQRLIGNLDIPVPQPGNTKALGTRERLQHLRRILTDDTIPPAPRLIGALVLLFGVSLAQITTLTLDDIVENTDGLRLRLGTEPVLLPEPIASLLRAFLADPRYRRNTATNRHSQWLFPGHRPGKSLHLNSVRLMLEGIGIPPRAARAAAWLQLVREAPPAVLAEALGVTANTAMRYAALASSDYLTYAAPPRSLPTR
ncbi:MAG: hypothetical protein M3O94_01625 [Actinomycetota bacterium]|nr:hypothetical protein [Actinomycetota bacterium]